MILTFDGTTPCRRFLRIGVKNNNLVDRLAMRVKKQQGDIDLSQFAASLKMCNIDYSFADKTSNVLVEEQGEFLYIVYVFKRKAMCHGALDMQLQFSKDTGSDTLIWQSEIFNIAFEDSLDISQAVCDKYPDVIEEIDGRLVILEKQIDDVAYVRQYEGFEDFPLDGNTRTIYIDKGTNKIYRFEPVGKQYHVIGTNYEEITVINANGGTNNGK